MTLHVDTRRVLLFMTMNLTARIYFFTTCELYVLQARVFLTCCFENVWTRARILPLLSTDLARPCLAFLLVRLRLPGPALKFLAASCHVSPCLVLPGLSLPCLALSCLALPCLAWPCLALPFFAKPCLALPRLAWFGRDLSCAVFSCLALPCLRFAMCYLALPGLRVHCLASLCLALPCLALPCLALPCLAYPWLFCLHLPYLPLLGLVLLYLTVSCLALFAYNLPTPLSLDDPPCCTNICLNNILSYFFPRPNRCEYASRTRGYAC